MVRRESRQFDGWTTVWLGLSVVWSIGLVAAGLFVRSYSSSNGPGLTLVQVNGFKVLIPLSIPFVGVVMIATALRRRTHAQKRGVGVLVWIVLGMMTVFVVLGAFSIGPFIGPVVVFLWVAITRVKGQLISLEPVAH